MAKFIDSKYVRDIRNVARQSYDNGWDERNGGNVSIRITEDELKDFDDVHETKRTLDLGFDAKPLAGQYFLVTGTGRYFRNIKERTEEDVGLVRITEDGKHIEVRWGYTDGARPTSEFPTHLMSHIARLKVDPEQRVVMHCHPTNLVAMSFTQPLDERRMTRILWNIHVESLVVYPEGVGIIPYMTPGTNEIGEATAAKMDKFRAVMWPHHGVFCVGHDADEAFGLIETIEKSAKIFTTVQAQGGNILQHITNEQFHELAKSFGVKPNPDFLD